MHTIIYSLATRNGRPELNYSLGLKIVFETPKELTVELPTGNTTLNKYEYLNTMKVYDDGQKTFFLVCNKQVDRRYAFKKLLEYATQKLQERIQNLETIKTQWDKIAVEAA